MKTKEHIAIYQQNSISSDAKRLMHLQRWAVYFATAVIIIGLLVLISWQFDLGFVQRPVTYLMAMNPATAVTFMLCGISILLVRPSQSPKKQYIGKLLASVIILIGLLRIMLHLFNASQGIDTILFNAQLTEKINGNYPNRMALNTAFSFVFSGLGLLLMNVETRTKKMPSHFISLFIFFASFISIIGYLYRINFFFGSNIHLPMAFHTAIGFLFIALAILLTNPGKGITKEMTSPFSGSFIARFLIPVSIIVPVLLGYIYLEGIWYRNVAIESGAGVFALSMILIFLSLTWFIVITLNKRDLHKRLTDQALLKFNETLEQKIQERTETIESSEKQYRYLFKNNPMPMWIIDLENFKFLDVNEIAIFQYGYTREEFLSMTAVDIRPEADKDLFIQADHSFHSTSKNYNRGIWNHVKKDGSIIQVEVIGHEILFEGIKARLILSNDVTEQKKAEEKLAAKEMHFRALIEHSAEGISLRDEFSNTFYRSPSAEKIMGKLPAIANIKNLTHPDDLEMLEQIDQEVLSSPGLPIDFQARFMHAEGHYIWLEGTFTNLLEVKAVNAIVSNYRDITKRKEAEEKIIASEKQFRTTLDNMLEGAQIIGFDWKYIYINDSLAKHAKYNRDDMIGHTVMEKFPGIEQTEIYKVYQRCFNERVSIHLENEFIFPDGSVGWFELSFQPIPEGIFILSIDITDRKNAEAAMARAEANYREIFDKASDGIYIHDIPGGKIIDTNQRAAEITGYSKEEILTIWANKFIAGSRETNINPAYIHLQKAATGAPQLFEWLSRKKDGTYTWLEVNLKKATIAGEERILSFFREINDRKKAQELVEKLNEELEQKVNLRTEQLNRTNQELEAFSYSVSHDLRAPLRAIIGFSTILQEDYMSRLDDEAKRITGVIISNTQKMGQLIDDLLTFSRMGRQNILASDVNTNEVVHEIVDELVKRENCHKKIKWKVHNLPPVKADMNIMRQVWINLISNAVKYSGKVSGPKIEIGASVYEDEVIFFVKDNGVGFDEKYKDKLFRVFQRLHTADEFEGTGIGLAIVEKVVSRHGGKVWAEAAVNKGACFYFSLPATVNNDQLTKTHTT